MLKTVLPRYPNLKTLGDAHLGRVFKEGVPLDRLGEREALVRADFQASLIENVISEDLVVQSGDLFDGFQVPNDVVLFAKQAVERAQAETGATYIFYRGNHDASRDTDKRSAFDLFQEYFVDHDKIHVYSEPTIYQHIPWVFSDGMVQRTQHLFTIGVMPWHPFKSAVELALELTQKANSYASEIAAVYTHCDLDSFGENTFNVMPYATLAELTKDVINGHVHTPELRQYKTTEIHMVGSMQPFSHGEDPTNERYITLTLAQLQQIHPHLLVDKNVRLLLQDGEEAPGEIPNCMAFTIKKSYMKADKEPIQETEMTDFNVESILKNTLINRNVVGKVSEAIMAHYDSIKGN